MSRRLLGLQLIAAGLLKEVQLKAALGAQLQFQGRLGTQLIELGYLGEDDVAAGLGHQHGLEAAQAVDFVRCHELRSALTPRVAQMYQAVPLNWVQKGTLLRVAMADPHDTRAVDELALVLGCRLQAVVAPELRIHAMLEKVYGIARPKGDFVRVLVQDPVGEDQIDLAHGRAGSAPAAAQRPRAPSTTLRSRNLTPPPAPATTPNPAADPAPESRPTRLREPTPLTTSIPTEPTAQSAPSAAIATPPATATWSGRRPAFDLTQAQALLRTEAETGTEGELTAAFRAVVEQPSSAALEPAPKPTLAASPAESRQTISVVTTGPRTLREWIVAPAARRREPPDAPTTGTAEHRSAAPDLGSALAPSPDPGSALAPAPDLGSAVALAPNLGLVPELRLQLDSDAPEAPPQPVLDELEFAPTSIASAADERLSIPAPAQSLAPAGNRARRGPSFPKTLNTLATTNHRDAAAEAALSYLERYFDATLFLVVKGGVAYGWKGAANGVDQAVIESLVVPLESGTLFHTAMESGHIVSGAPATEGMRIHRRLWKLLQLQEPEELIVCPVTLGPRAVNLIYAHPAPGRRMKPMMLSNLSHLASAVAQAYRRAIKSR